MWIKLNANSAGVGMPDRLLLSSFGAIVWCELKTLGGTLSPAQKHTHHELIKKRQRVVVIRGTLEFQYLVDTLNRA